MLIIHKSKTRMRLSIIFISIIFLTQIIMINFLSSCSQPNSFESELRYTSKLNISRKYHFHTKGKLDEGADMANSYQGELLIYQDSSSHRINFKAENFVPKLIDFQSSSNFNEYELGMDIDSKFFSSLLVIIDSSLSNIYAQKEGGEVFESLKMAGMGPKIGTRQFEIIHLQSQDHKYKE